MRCTIADSCKEGAMHIVLNGTPRKIPRSHTLADLLVDLGLPRDGIAVAVDDHVVPRGEHETRTLHEGARIEIIRAVGGG